MKIRSHITFIIYPGAKRDQIGSTYPDEGTKNVENYVYSCEFLVSNRVTVKLNWEFYR